MTRPPLRLVRTKAGELLTPDVVTARIEDLNAELSSESDRLTGLILESARLTMLVDLMCAQVVEASGAGTVDRRKAHGLTVCSLTPEPGVEDRRDILTRQREAAAEVFALREAQHSRRAILDGLRSQGAAVRAEFAASSYTRGA